MNVDKKRRGFRTAVLLPKAFSRADQSVAWFVGNPDLWKTVIISEQNC